MKTYTKEEAKYLLRERDYQIYKDCDNLDLLSYVIGRKASNNYNYFHYLNSKYDCFTGYNTINLSQIIDEDTEVINKEPNLKKMTFKYSDLQFKKDDITWRDYKWFDKTIELRFKPDYSKEIEALEKKAAEYGEKVIINFEVLSNDSNIDNIKPDPSERPITTTIMRNGKIEKYFDGEKWKDINAL